LTGASRGGSLQQAGRAAKIEQALPGFDQRRRLRMLHVEDQHAGIDVPGRGFFGNDSARDQRRIGMLLEVGGEIEFEVDNEGIGVEIDDPAVEVRVQSLVQKIDAIEGCVPGMPAALYANESFILVTVQRTEGPRARRRRLEQPCVFCWVGSLDKFDAQAAYNLVRRFFDIE